jgi:hypothetical protein
MFTARYVLPTQCIYVFCTLIQRYKKSLKIFISRSDIAILRSQISVVGIATTLRAGRSEDWIPVGARFSAPIQTGSEAHPASCTMGTGCRASPSKWFQEIYLSADILLKSWRSIIRLRIETWLQSVQINMLIIRDAVDGDVRGRGSGGVGVFY